MRNCDYHSGIVQEGGKKGKGILANQWGGGKQRGIGMQISGKETHSDSTQFSRFQNAPTYQCLLMMLCIELR